MLAPKANLAVLVVVALLGVFVTACAPPATNATSTGCDRLDSLVYERVDPTNQSSYLTTSPAEAAAVAQKGYTQRHVAGPSFKAATASGPGLVEVHRLYRAKNRDYLWSTDAAEIKAAVEEDGYVDQATAFYGSAERSDCLVPVHRYLYRGQHRLVVDDAARERLERAGWRDEGVQFYAAPVKAGDEPRSATPTKVDESKFTFAVMPDTQLEVIRASDRRLWDRSVWLVENQERLNLAFVAHIGDIVDKDNPTHDQYKRARQGLRPLDAAGIPYTLAVGNHDTASTCTDAVVTCSGPAAVKGLRDTSSFNKFFNTDDYTGFKGQFEKGKVDNVYATYEAGGAEWLVLTLEFWPRTEVVRWANEVVSDHPDANVVVVTHHYLTSTGDLARNNAGSGSHSAQYLFDNLIRKHPNIKIVLSGHTGAAAQRVDEGDDGHKIYSFLQAIHDTKSNPLRLVEVDASSKTLKTWVYAPHTDYLWAGSEKTLPGFVVKR